MTQNIVIPSSNLIILYTFAILETGHNHDNNLIVIYLHVSLYIRIHVNRTTNIDNFSGFIICDSNYAIFLL